MSDEDSFVTALQKARKSKKIRRNRILDDSSDDETNKSVNHLESSKESYSNATAVFDQSMTSEFGNDNNEDQPKKCRQSESTNIFDDEEKGQVSRLPSVELRDETTNDEKDSVIIPESDGDTKDNNSNANESLERSGSSLMELIMSEDSEAEETDHDAEVESFELFAKSTISEPELGASKRSGSSKEVEVKKKLIMSEDETDDEALNELSKVFARSLTIPESEVNENPEKSESSLMKPIVSEDSEVEGITSSMNMSVKRKSFYRESGRFQDKDIDTDSETEVENQLALSRYSPHTRRSIMGFQRRSLAAQEMESSDSEEDLFHDSNDSMDLGSPTVVKTVAEDVVLVLDTDDEEENGVKSLANESCVILESSSEDEKTNDTSLNVSQFNLCVPQVTSTPSTKTRTILQPKIETAINRETIVSQEFYDQQCFKLSELEMELQKSTRLVITMKSQLPDGGRRMSGRIDKLKSEIEAQLKYITTLRVEPINVDEKPKLKPFAPIVPSWDDLNAGVSSVQPKFFGKIGMQNFNAVKAMTMDRLRHIHGSLDTCPTEDVIADDPPGLKIPLMNHQRHALKWMEWRESQRPRGGILGDDMGLGKTLTCIAYILHCKALKENDSGGESSSDSDDDQEKSEENKWLEKGRRDYYDGGTLVVCPASLIGQWESEINKRVKRGYLTATIHHGNSRETNPRRLSSTKFDIVVTTYSIVGQLQANPLLHLKWDRVILDEGHVIRNHKTKISIGCCELRKKNKWILSGTPIHNKEMDVFSLLKFLQCRPFDELSHFKKWIDNKSEGGKQRLATIMKGLLLRRTKDILLSKGEINSLPTKELRLVEFSLRNDEKKIYQNVLLFSQQLFSQYLHQRAEKTAGHFIHDGTQKQSMSKDKQEKYRQAHNKLKQTYGNSMEVKTHQILVLLLRLRQICSHCGLITEMISNIEQAEGLSDEAYDEEVSQLDLLKEISQLNIGDDEIEVEEPGASSTRKRNYMTLSNPVFDFDNPSSKFRTIINIVRNIVDTSEDKIVIVSQWAQVLQLLSDHIVKELNVSCLSLTGNVPVHKRTDIISSFNSTRPLSPRIMFLSLMAGGVGLNLVGGNHLFLIDPHWNPQLESQAQDRVYRIGQSKPVTIYKLICSDTVEQRIKALQDMKLELANNILTGAKTSTVLSIDDLKNLFDI